MSLPSTNPRPIRLSRVEQLTLNTWRWACRKLGRVLDANAILEQAALHAVLASLRDVDQPTALFRHHAEAYPEFSLITSVVPAARQTSLAYDILDSAFLMRWNELVADGNGPEELPPLRAQPAHDAPRQNA